LKQTLIFKDSWHAKLLALLLTIQVFFHFSTFLFGDYSFLDGPIFVLLFFLWISVIFKQRSFLTFGGYYMALAGYYLGIQLSNVFTHADAATMAKVLWAMLYVHFYGTILYLLWNRKNFATISQREAGEDAS
jgi:hypothetical protein